MAVTESHKLHVFFFPFMSPGHQIPMLDMARAMATRRVKVTIVTTRLNLCRFQTIIDRDKLSGDVDIEVCLLDFPFAAAGLPPDCENLDALPSRLMSSSFIRATALLQPQADDLVRQLRPDAIISDLNIPWTAEIARIYNIPRIAFYGTCFFSLCVSDSVTKYRPYENIDSDTQPFLVPGLPDRVGIMKAHMPSRFFRNIDVQDFFRQFMEAERNTYGVVANTFYEIEPEYVNHYRKISGKKVWPVGPVSLYRSEAMDMAERGNRSSVDEDQCRTWLDSKQPNSVLYVCFGSLCDFAESQLVEIGLGLEASNCCFIWVIREGQGGGVALDDLAERVNGRGLIIRGWAPQLLILNHPAVGGFMTHCGWNSVLESVSAGVPVIAWPLFAEQFYNMNLALTRLRIGIGTGVFDTGLEWGEEERAGALVKRNRVAAAVTRLMGNSELVKEMRERVSELSELAKSAVSDNGSSRLSLDLLIGDLLHQRMLRLGEEKD